PTGRRLDRFDIPGIGRIGVSVIDMANVCAFVAAADVGLDDDASVVALQAKADVVARLEAIRTVVAREVGLIGPTSSPDELMVRVNPLLMIVGSARPYVALDGTMIEAASTDLF